MISLYNKTVSSDTNYRRLEQMDSWGKIVQYGRQNPVWFIENILGCPLLDYQKYMILGGWLTPRSIYVQSRASGKSFIAALIIMAKCILYPNYKVRILAPVGRQSRALYDKIEDIALGNLESITTSNSVFVNELVKTNGSATGFVKSTGDAHFELYNGSEVIALNGKAENIVSARANLLVFDEAGKINNDFFSLVKPFIAVDSNFRTGVDHTVYPTNIPNQCYLFSSAEDTSTYLWQSYKEGAKHMMMGLNDIFVCDITCEMPLRPTMNGKAFPPLLTQGQIDDDMRDNEYKARREYYNLFDLTGGQDSVVTLDAIFRNEGQYLPLTKNPDGTSGKQYIIAVDPAHQIDNSFCLVTEIWCDPNKGWVGRIVNGYNMMKTMPNGEKKLFTMPEAIDFIRELMIAYNGIGAAEWNNLHVFIDPGAGGGGTLWADYLRQDWTDKYGITHYGIIDLEDEVSAKERWNFPHAVPGVLHLWNAQKYRNAFFESLREMTSQDLIMFTPPCPRSDKIYFDETEIDLSPEDRRALIEIDLTKEEAKLVRKLVTDKGNTRYGFPPSVERKVHDDRVFCLAVTCYTLSVIRKERQFGGRANEMNFLHTYDNATKQKTSLGRQNNTKNPFSGKGNPFSRRKV